MFDKVQSRMSLPELERRMLRFWQEDGTFEALKKQNEGKPRWSFLDGPITANNPMGVHHAWGRTYKDCLPALPGHDRTRAPLPERLRLPGPLGRGRGREGARLPVQARHRDLRPGEVRREVQGARPQVRPAPDRAVHPARTVDGLGRLVLHDGGREQLHHLGLPEEVPRAGATLRGPRQHAVVPALRHRHQPAGDERGLQRGHRPGRLRADAPARARA